MKKHIFLFVALLLSFAPPAHAADPTMGIVAVVNDEAVTSSDLDGRMRLALLGSGIQPNEEVLKRLREQMLRTLIDEKLQLQSAKDSNALATDAEIDEQVAKLADQNKITPAQLPAFFARNGVPITALRQQLLANISWAKLVQRKLRPQVDIGDEEVDDAIARLQANAGKPEFLLAEIFLPVSTPAQEKGVEQAAYKLIEQMSKGARFSVIARQFSQSATAATGGDMGWVLPGQIDPDLDAAVSRMSPGTVSAPIRTPGGYHILMLRDVRQTSVAGGIKPDQMSYALRQVLLPLTAASQMQATASKLNKLREQAKSCADMERLAKAQGDSRGGDLGSMTYNELPEGLRGIISALPPGTPSAPMQNERGVLFLMVCDRTPLPGATPASVDREQILNQLGNQKLELLARRYMRDLRQSAFIDVRG